jgi:hypothetical protein
MIKHDALLDEIEKDNKIDQMNLEGEINRCLSLTTKYLRFHREYKQSLVRMWAVRNKKELERQEFYAGRAANKTYRDEPFNIEVKNSTEMRRWIEGDPALVAMDEAIKLAEDSMAVIEGMLDSLKYRPNHIQTILEIRRFESGA